MRSHRFTNLWRNEVKSSLRLLGPDGDGERGKGELYLCTSDDIIQRVRRDVLQDVLLRPILT